MAFTSPELVRAHLSDIRLAETALTDVTAVLTGSAPVQLPHTGLVAGSVTVKGRRATAPQSESKNLADDWVGLSYTHLVKHSVLAAADSSLGTVYVENGDFIVDDAGGRVRRLTSGSISSGQKVYLWYEPYFVYSDGDDYTVNESAGLLTRQSGGAIGDGQTVLVDYRAALGAVSDAVVEQAIAEAGDAVLSMIDSAHRESAPTGVVIGETHWAVAVVSRMRAAAAMAETGAHAAVARAAAQMWLELAAQYQTSGRERLAPFAAPAGTLRAGQLS